MAFIHYKFRSARDYDSIVVDGMGMSVFDLKLEIVRQKKLKGEDFDLMLSNAESGEDYRDDSTIVARNSSVVVRRTPVPDAKRRGVVAGTAKYNLEELRKSRQVVTPLASVNFLGNKGGGSSSLVSELVPVGPHLTRISNVMQSNSQGMIPGLGSMLSFSENNNYNSSNIYGSAAASGEPSFGHGIPGLRQYMVEKSDEDEEYTNFNLAHGNGDEEAQLRAMFQANKFHWEATQEKMAGLKRVKFTPHTGSTIATSGQSGEAGKLNQFQQQRQPPPGYVCYRCGVKGHFIQDCPTNGDVSFDRPKVKRTTGIPKSFLKEIDPGGEGNVFPLDASTVMMNSEGKIVQFISNEAAWRKIQNQMTAATVSVDSIPELTTVPPDLECKICLRLLRDAIEVPCCFTSYCEECIHAKLSSSNNDSTAMDGNNKYMGRRCPACNTEIITENLAPSPDLRRRAFQFLRDFMNQRHVTTTDSSDRTRNVAMDQPVNVSRPKQITSQSNNDTETAQNPNKISSVANQQMQHQKIDSSLSTKPIVTIAAMPTSLQSRITLRSDKNSIKSSQQASSSMSSNRPRQIETTIEATYEGLNNNNIAGDQNSIKRKRIDDDKEEKLQNSETVLKR